MECFVLYKAKYRIREIVPIIPSAIGKYDIIKNILSPSFKFSYFVMGPPSINAK